MTTPAAVDVGLAARVAATLTGLTALTALAIHLAAGAATRDLLGFGFGGVEPTFADAAAIFANNARVLAAVLVAAAGVRLGFAEAGDRWERAALTALRTVCDAVIVLGCTLHVLVIGAAFGAYGTRTLAATALHAPGELAAFSLALALYLRARRGAAGPTAFAATAGLALAALAVAALAETFAY
ncbi:MAG: hypothetical protein GXY03_11415 [Solirubrobacterales bacterium]|nr:hypothetical protein [Solirubrobacterales bacterium]